MAVFVTPHGFGHACRAAAVMEELRRLDNNLRFELFTTSPPDIFSVSVGNNFGYHRIKSDVGVVQLTPLLEDLNATCEQLGLMLPFQRSLVGELAERIRSFKCRLVLCDISPLGLQVAEAANIPSVLVENFTWDWVYEGYLPDAPCLRPFIDQLAAIYRKASLRIQTPPLCRAVENSIYVEPISRAIRTDRKTVRRQLGVAESANMVVVSLGGVPDSHMFLDSLPPSLDAHLVVTGTERKNCNIHPHVTLLPPHSSFFHPDLLGAADALVGKAGYSTVAEVWQCGLPFGCIQRPHSPEADVLEAFISSELMSIEISPEEYADGSWLHRLPELLAMDRRQSARVNGSTAAAKHIAELLNS